jgi:hypothetical protein
VDLHGLTVVAPRHTLRRAEPSEAHPPSPRLRGVYPLRIHSRVYTRGFLRRRVTSVGESHSGNSNHPNRSVVCRKTRNSVVVSNHLKFQISRSHLFVRRGDRAVEGARLEIVCTPNKGTGGSNPPLSAIPTTCICSKSISLPSLGFGEGFGFVAFRAASPNTRQRDAYKGAYRHMHSDPPDTKAAVRSMIGINTELTKQSWLNISPEVVPAVVATWE